MQAIAKGFGANLQHTMKILLLGEKKRETKPGKEAEEMTQRLQTLAARQFQKFNSQYSYGDSAPSITPFLQKSNTLFWPPRAPGMHMIHRCRCKQNTHIQIK